MAAIDLIASRYRELKTARNEIMSTLAAQVEAKVSEVRTRFEDLVWEAYDRDKVSVSEIARQMGGSRTTVYEILKKRESYNEAFGAGPEYRMDVSIDPATGRELVYVEWPGYETESGPIDIKGTFRNEGGGGYFTSKSKMSGVDQQGAIRLSDHASYRWSGDQSALHVALNEAIEKWTESQ